MVVILHAAIGAGVWFERFVLLAPRVLIRPVTILATELAIPFPETQPHRTGVDCIQVIGDLRQQRVGPALVLVCCELLGKPTAF